MTEAQEKAVALAFYVDLENLPRHLDFERLLKRLSEDDGQTTYAVKAAYGNTSQIATKLRKQLGDCSFRIVDTPHLCGKKNRADLMISIDAFERMHVNVPPIDRFVFATSDSDFHFEKQGILRTGSSEKGELQIEDVDDSRLGAVPASMSTISCGAAGGGVVVGEGDPDRAVPAEPSDVQTVG